MRTAVGGLTVRRMIKRLRRIPRWATGLGAIVVLGAGSSAVMAIPGSPGVIRACHATGGYLRMPEPGAACREDETQIDWDQRGSNVPGPTGAEGPAGATGPSGLSGPTGPTGPRGLHGDVGKTGLRGPTGARGTTGSIGQRGPQGPVGPAGASGLPHAYVGTSHAGSTQDAAGFGDNWTLLNDVSVPAGNYLVSAQLAWSGKAPNATQAGRLYCRLLPNTSETFLLTVDYQRGDGFNSGTKSIGSGGLDRIISLPSGGTIQLSCRSGWGSANVQSSQMWASQVA
ncbi:MAG: hypothetical protein QOF76_3515 [Solirubrobacteraceae bacterium]|nr:hypothetical protein [Solirubrobacteraceae bacterium]